MESFISLILHHAHLVGIEDVITRSLFGSDPHCPYLSHLTEWMVPKLISRAKQNLKNLKDYASSATQNVFESFDIISEDVIFAAQAQMSSELAIRETRMRTELHNWSRLWKRVAIDPAPWSVNLGNNAFFRRDCTFCNNFIPSKLKRNWKFDDHKKASMTRDCGNPTTAEILLQRAIEEKKGHENSLQLLEITDNDTAQEQRASKGSMNRPVFSLPVLVHNPVKAREATFLLFGTEIVLRMAKGKRKVIQMNEVSHMFFRRVNHLPNAIEIFTECGKCYFIQFLRHNSLAVLKRMSQYSFPRAKLFQTAQFQIFFKQNALTPLWIRGKVSNFEYLMHLNMMSGRTFNDLSQYPVFPWVISDFTSPTLDFTKPSTFRDLSKPVGALNAQRLTELEERTREMIQEKMGNYLYPSSYSCLLTVSQYLVRMEPFTTIHIDVQGGKFDKGPRIFSSIQETYQSVTTNSNDFRELTPEFFCCPEFLVNSNEFDLGSNSKGKVDDVILPEWAHGSAALFVYTMRKALECDVVSLALHNWIDLIWGVKQRGPQAVTAKNTFRAELYDSIWNDTTMSEQQRAEVDAALTHIGQIPAQLFTCPHPQKNLAGAIRAPFASPFVVTNKKVADARLARIEALDDWKYRVVTVDATGVMMVNTVDFTNKKPLRTGIGCALSKPTIYNPNGLTMSPSISDTSIQELEMESVNGVAVTTAEKEVKGFRDAMIVWISSNYATDLQSPMLAAVSETTNKLLLVDTKKCTVEDCLHDVVGIYSDGEFIAAARTNAVVNIYKGDFTRHWLTIPSYGASIMCCCVNKAFLMTVIGTRDGSLIVSSLSKGSTVRVIDLNGARPFLVTVTNEWGFIVVYAERIRNGKLTHHIYVFSVNGERLGKTKIDGPISCWTTWTSTSGFDYMIYADTNGKLFFFEVFYCNPADSFHRCRAPVLSVRYFQDLACVVAALKDGRVLFIPQSLAA